MPMTYMYFQKPTSTIYYQKCLDQIKIDATCEMLRCKVRYWKATFNKAEEWRKSTGAGIDVNDDCSTIKGNSFDYNHFAFLTIFFNDLQTNYEKCARIMIAWRNFFTIKRTQM